MADEALTRKEKEKLKEIYKEAKLTEVTIKPEPYTCKSSKSTTYHTFKGLSSGK
ncbi:hypothetical protein [Sulfuricurvum sp.]|uniref:hypothetical protein n=1 Tax=Sulfuricurvum sp. TaxID=2025608 RepID=UPI00260F5101|nr:hypothetical protein [Sulfuricurvum sp.]MDD3595837.1 hypothetical protein [Sulfuricurvum sp.]